MSILNIALCSAALLLQYDKARGHPRAREERSGRIAHNHDMQLGRTIQIFLPDGNPRGVKIAEFTGRTVQAVLVPRAQLEFACSRSELAKVGVYFLFGDAVAANASTVYIGEAEDCVIRLKQQNKLKDWWSTAVVCVSKAGGFTKSHVKYLEWHCHAQAALANRFNLDNPTTPTKSFVSEPMEADLLDYFETIRVLVGTLGFPVFDQIPKPKKADVLTCKGKKAFATGEYTEDGLIVLAGSTSNRVATDTTPAHILALRQQLFDDGTLKVVDQHTVRFTKDKIFTSPSQAADVVLARSANGWLEWKYPDGRTLDEVKRKSLAD